MAIQTTGTPAALNLRQRFAAWLAQRFPREEINGGNTCPTYLFRWELFRRGDYAVYLHHFVGDDWALDAHNHPKRFISIGLWGSYVEHVYLGVDEYDQDIWEVRRYRAPWIRTFPASHAHRITVDPGQGAWTLVAVLKAVQDWGFYWGGTLVQWRLYVTQFNQTRKACP
jgi:hypothetical protein